MLVSAVNHVHHHIYLCIMRMPVPHDLLGREVGVEGGGRICEYSLCVLFFSVDVCKTDTQKLRCVHCECVRVRCGDYQCDMLIDGMTLILNTFVNR